VLKESVMHHDSILDALAMESEPFALCELAPHGRLPMAAGPSATLHYVLSGAGEFAVTGRTPIALETGALVLVPAGLRHSLTGKAGAPVTLAACQPATVGLRHYRSGAAGEGIAVLCGRVTLGLRGAGAVVDILRAPLVEPAAGAGVPGRALDLVVGELAEPQLGSRAMIRTLLLECLIDLLRRRLAADDPALAWMPALVDRRLWPALQAMLDDPGGAHSVESLAGRVAMSRSRFAERFQQAYGSGPMALLRELRLVQAARLLAESDAGIDRVAELSGYASRSYFSQQFEARFGRSPGRFRRDAAWLAAE
jgi:AraC-like DNA-binding protein/quercetin dioxygenase-like cupin family protein